MTSPALDSPRPTAPDPAEPLVIVQRPRKHRSYALWVLFGITALAALARFPNLDKPALWYAEVQGAAADDGRVLSPFVIRLLPAVAGTLLPPAVYFLATAATMISRRTALVAAAFAALSGWALTLSREAQTNAPIWLVTTAAVAAAVGLARRRTWVAVFGTIIVLLGAWWYARGTSPLNELGAARGTVALLSGVVLSPAEQRIFVPPIARRWMLAAAVTVMVILALGLVPRPRKRAPKIVFDADARTPSAHLLWTTLGVWMVVALLVGRLSYAVPPVAVVVAALLTRIWLTPLRWICVALVFALNFLAAAAPVAGQVEPPVDQIAHDVWHARDLEGSARTFVQFRDGSADRGGGTIFNDVGKYYLAVEARGREPIPPVNPITSRREIIEQVTSSSQLERIVVWDYFSQAAQPALPPRPLEDDLPPGWKLISEGHRAVWGQGWQYRYTARRREYVKSPPMDAEPTDH